MATPTVYDAMKGSLESVRTRRVENPGTSASESTKKQDPIRVLLPNDKAALLKLASDGLERLPSSSQCRTARMPRLEKSHLLRTEADVLRLSALQLVHPVNLVLEDLLPSGGQLLCLAEVLTQTDRGRTDLKWTCNLDDKSATVAILEYKNTRVIRKTDFSPAFTTEDRKAKDLARAYQTPYEENTLLEGNAITLSKQVNKYSRDCKDIALFDWHSMCVFELEQMDHNDAAGFTFSSDPAHFRQLLLGMILKGLKRKGIIS